MNLIDQRSNMGGRIGDELNRLWQAMQTLRPVDGAHLSADHTTRGVMWKPTTRLLARGGNAVIHKAEITTVGEKTLTCTDMDAAGTITVNRPDYLRSYASTRNTASDPDNWLPADGDTSSSGASFNYANVNYRVRIIHISDASIDYLRHIERIDPLYTVGDVIYAYQDGSNWEDINVDGRHWRQVFDYDPTIGGAFDMAEVFTNQDTDQLYATSNPGWLTATDYSAWDQY